MSVTIRSARIEDAERLLEIYRPYVLETAVSFEQTVPGPEQFRQRIAETLKRHPYLVAEEDGRIIGYAYASFVNSRESAWHTAQSSIYLDRTQRRKGVGRLLYESLERELVRQNVLSVFACIARSEQEDDPYLSRDSLKFHCRCGYEYCGIFRRCGYKFGRWYSLVWMEKQVAERREDMPPFVPREDLQPGD